MKKIAVITFCKALNYGAVLQAYALTKILSTKNLCIHIIDYKCNADYKTKYVFLPKKCILFFKWIKNFTNIRKAKKYILFRAFRKKYLRDIKKVYNENISSLSMKYDLFFTGSDQVFNPRLIGFDKNYFLDFVQDKNKCFSYAASFGLSYEDLNDKEKLFIKENLQNFKYLSLREKQGADIVNKLSNIKSQVHIDPTLVLNKQDWSKIAKNVNQNNYILLYLMNENDKIINFARNLSKYNNIEIKYITTLKNTSYAKCIQLSPEEWIGYFLKAKYIVTNSFHGLAFSINFNKQFFVDLLPSYYSINCRLESLLDLTNLRDRLIDNIGTNYDKPINWYSVNKIIEKEREKSIDYLKNIIC